MDEKNPREAVERDLQGKVEEALGSPLGGREGKKQRNRRKGWGTDQ